ncbi:MAG: 6-bladed beta-propeller [Gemmatimonadaceae bacterium]
MIRATPLAVAFLILANCRANDSKDSASTTVDSAGVRITTINASPSALDEWALAPATDLTLTGAETGDSAAFAYVGASRWLSDGRIVVVDAEARRLLLFDDKGRLVKTLGRRGAGPGEFRNVSSVTVLPGDSLLTFDRSLRRLTVWHPESGYVRGMPVGGTSLESWPEDAWLWQRGNVVVLQLSITPQDSIPPGAGGVRRWPMRARLTLLDTSGRALGSSPQFDGMYTGIYERGDTRLPFSNRPFAAVGRDRIYFGSGATFALAYLNSEFAAVGELRWPAQREDLSQAEVAAVKAEAVALAGTRVPPDQLVRPFEINFAAQILPRERPAIGRVFVDHNDRLWVERFEATRLGSSLQKAGDRWTVLNRDGAPVARLRLPSATRLEDVRGTRALLVVRDSLDVQTVVVREIRKQ